MLRDKYQHSGMSWKITTSFEIDGELKLMSNMQIVNKSPFKDFPGWPRFPRSSWIIFPAIFSAASNWKKLLYAQFDFLWFTMWYTWEEDNVSRFYRPWNKNS